MELIDKVTVVAEIKRRKELVSDPILLGNDLIIGERNAYFNLLSFLDTLEVKEVDLESEIENVRKSHFINSDFDKATLDGRNITNIAKHFFKLGLKAAQKGE